MSLQLDAVVTNTVTNQPNPVWRLAIVSTETVSDVPVDQAPDVPNGTKIDRVVYFAPNMAPLVIASPPYAGDAEIFYRSGTTALYIPPNRYMVIGPGDLPRAAGPAGSAGQTTIYDMSSGSATAVITLTESNNILPPNQPNTNGITITGATQTYPTLAVSSGNVQKAMACIIDSPRRLSVSEPYKGGSGDGYLSEHDARATPVGTPTDTPWDSTDPTITSLSYDAEWDTVARRNGFSCNGWRIHFCPGIPSRTT